MMCRQPIGANKLRVCLHAERLRAHLPGQFQGGLLLVLSQHRGVPRYVEWYWREHIYKIVSTHIIVSNKYICSILLRCNKSALMSSIL
ncbi:hypothetical protein KL86DES1_22173 [uncultured Desulfovibrio sp.]|uniref:Uncharacterized protein n=1 Tax=uncultured Desulfovibrio sp. TaxID=167968 RepID=A0A212LBE9_9BACT|nr:hypothetical protein KL86DES1_22173 [uncultured Desulfovibrio sp.]VZH35067.1 conserved protein of unknown function [Desulfovibrio sp. 86]